ncbi:histone deacetylase clr3 [Punctularia strigosozonata HHB-11173 SS5]|uniref:histone deacetylase clr3 n=1 Tax=Punctularia strigosozonata (strain HHB-11173) TaxID=741275 RepID=UPI000441687A|nr:histone deacetylase clr3 [Punctularia strigosozonata HHB-11173 SS5]EIN11329.1 histone deacetylase clr3 [Punctularia strigosozonata HHB-11173 SS5]
MDVDGNRPEAVSTDRDPIPHISHQRASSEPIDFRLPRHSIGYVFDARMMAHSCLDGHPEQPERIVSIYRLLAENGCLEKMKHIPIRMVKKQEALLVHSEELWDKVLAISRLRAQDIEDTKRYYELMSLYVNPHTPSAARLSCGGVIEATLAVARGEVRKSFAIVRPPGHHAEPEEHMGFCFFNNVAVAVRVAQQLTKIRKVLILDWDIHHGNGTQKAFNDDPDVLYISLHRYDAGQFYPSTTFGAMNSCGEGPGIGFSVNIPWPGPGMRDADYLHAFQKIVMPIAIEFAPELVIISAGFDAADGDELGECHVTPTGYAHMTHMLSSLAGGKLVVALEGGYNLQSIANSSLAVAKVILGEAPPQIAPMVASELGTETVWQVARQQSKWWKNVDPKACEPKSEVGDIAYSIPEILKAHRQSYLYETHKLHTIPLLPAYEELFSAQVACTADILDNPTLIVFVHGFGEMRVELEGAMTCNMDLERSYLLDVSKKMIEWVRVEGYGLIDLNILENVPKSATPVRWRARTGTLNRNLLTYMWDNYIQLSKAKQVVLIGHGPGCDVVIETISERASSVPKIVIAVIQVVGLSKLPLLPKKSMEILGWYRACSQVFVPKNHPIFSEGKILGRHGHVIASGTLAVRVDLIWLIIQIYRRGTSYQNALSGTAGHPRIHQEQTRFRGGRSDAIRWIV